VLGDVIKGTLPSIAVFAAQELGHLTVQVTLLTGYVTFGTVCPLQILQINIVQCHALGITVEIKGSMHGMLMTFQIFNLRSISKL